VAAIALTIDAARYAERPVDQLGVSWLVQFFKFTTALLISSFAFTVSIRLAPWLRFAGVAVLMVCVVMVFRSCSGAWSG
jgi:hypothetical protein